MKSWYSPAELAGLPGMPKGKRQVNKLAKTANWKSRQRAGRGGGREYCIDSLPETTRRYLVAQETQTQTEFLPAIVEQNPPALIEQPAISELKDWQREVMHARLAVLAWIDDLIPESHSRRHAITKAIKLIEQGDLPEGIAAQLLSANARANGARKLSRATLYDWFKSRDNIGPVGLAPASGKQALTPTWLAPFLKLYQRPQKPTVAQCLRDWPKHYPDQPAPAERTVNRWLEKMPREMREFGRMGRNARRAVQPFTRRTTDGLYPMDIVVADGHAFKAYVRHPNAPQKVRPEVTTYLDVATRRAIGFSAWISESQMGIWEALRDMVLNPEFGIMVLHYSDNGAYTGKEHRAIIERIGGSLMFSHPYRAQARGVIERFNSSVWVPFAKQFFTYSGDDMDKEALRRALRKVNDDDSMLMHWQDFQMQARQALDDYNNRPHSYLNKRTPNEAWEQAVAAGWHPTLLENDDLHDLLPSETRIVKRGEVRLSNRIYFDDDLRAYEGRSVSVAYHPGDGSRVWCSDSSGRLICIAMRNANARPFVPETRLEEARAKRKAGRLRALDRKKQEVIEEGATQYEMPALDIAMRPVPRNTTPVRTLSEEQERELAEIVTLPVRPRELTMEEEREKSFAEWEALDARMRAGETLVGWEQEWHRDYQDTPEFKHRQHFKRFEEEFSKR